MRKTQWAINTVLFAAFAAVASSASALPIVDVILGAPTSITVGSPLIFTHDFTDNAAPNNYAVGTDSISSAGLTIVLTDDNGNENYTISFGIEPQVYSYTANIDGATSFNFSVVAPSLANLSDTGLLGVKIAPTDCNGSRCDAYALKFVSSTLTVEAIRGAPAGGIESTNAVPEPASALLLGVGLMALWAVSRRRQQAKDSVSS